MKYVFNGQYKRLRKRYEGLQKRYELLEKNYRAVSRDPRLLAREMRRFAEKRVPSLVSLPIAAAGMVYYRHYAIILIGLLAMAADVIWEEYNTRKGIWRYDTTSVLMLFKRVPIGVPISYFLLCAALAAYVLFRIGYAPVC